MAALFQAFVPVNALLSIWTTC
ncbi:UNVERIFIED_CONTAM: hypothetical protein GTU68_021685 [Idotea baltica]|nr:hypothetical protein [Idotea baltica]